jgi:threonine dehydratase
VEDLQKDWPSMDWIRMISDARERIYGLVLETPVKLVENESGIYGSTKLFMKLENLQKTGSFKLRGATNKVLSLPPESSAKGVVTSSTGNHGLAVAAAARHKGIDAEVYVSTSVPQAKLEWIKSYGARVRTHGENPLEAEIAARAEAAESGRTYISPYNDSFVVAGQGTIAAELCQQVQEIDAVFVAVGGGGLIGGIGAYLANISPRTAVIGCWPENSRVLYESLKVGHIIEFPESATLSESTTGGVEKGSITFELCSKVVKHFVLVSESEILEALRWAHRHNWIVEGSAAVALASFFKEAPLWEGKNIIVICCGGNVAPEVLQQV